MIRAMYWIGSVMVGGVLLAAATSPSKLERLTVGDGLDRPNQKTVGVSTERWNLAGTNMTTDIESGWRYGRYVVVFGRAGTAGLNTIIDAATGSEVLEFLGFNPIITPEGRILFLRFYPRGTSQDVLSERMAMLDLNQDVPRSVPRKHEVPTDSVGIDIYPFEGDADRHVLMTDISEDFSTLFVLDRTSSGRLCVSRLSLSDQKNHMQRCLSSADLIGADPGKIQIVTFKIQPGSELEFAFSGDPGIGANDPASTPHTVTIDRRTLAVSVQQMPHEVNHQSVRVPWGVQRAMILKAQDAHFSATVRPETLKIPLKAKLLIDVYGKVVDVTLTGSTSEVLDSVRAALLRWSFKPTLLNGRPIEVITQFNLSPLELGAAVK